MSLNVVLISLMLTLNYVQSSLCPKDKLSFCLLFETIRTITDFWDLKLVSAVFHYF